MNRTVLIYRRYRWVRSFAVRACICALHNVPSVLHGSARAAKMVIQTWRCERKIKWVEIRKMSQRKTTTRATTIVSGVSLEWEIDNGWWNIVASAVLPSYCVCIVNIVSIFSSVKCRLHRKFSYSNFEDYYSYCINCTVFLLMCSQTNGKMEFRAHSRHRMPEHLTSFSYILSFKITQTLMASILGMNLN